MRLEEITYLLDSFNETLRTNANFLDLYKIEVNLHEFPEIGYRVELFMVIGDNQMIVEGLKEHRKNIGSYPLDTYELKDFFHTTDRVVNSFDKSKWFSNWKKSIEREYKLKNLGI